jgi:hypothetical protein
MELGNYREWLRRFRGEMEVGLVRIHAFLNEMELSRPGQERKASD